jgi:hypothetical protein
MKTAFLFFCPTSDERTHRKDGAAGAGHLWGQLPMAQEPGLSGGWIWEWSR